MSQDDILTREPPHSDDAELAVLGAVMVRTNALDQIADKLKDEHFYRTAHRLLYGAMLAIHAKREQIDPITLSAHLRANGRLEEVGGLVFIDRLMDVTATSANVAKYAKIVVDNAILRRLIAVSHEILASAYSGAPDGVSSVVDSAMSAISEIGMMQTQDSVVHVKQAAKEVLDTTTKFIESGFDWSGVPTGFVDLDKIMRGLQNGDLAILAARPGMGKTALALSVADFVAAPEKHGHSVLFFSMEMPRRQIAMRLMYLYGKITADDMRNRNIAAAKIDEIISAASAIYEHRLHIDDRAAQTLTDIRSKARRIKYEHGLDLIVIDYVQLMTGPKSAGSREQEIAAISRGLKALAKELDIPVLALAQLNRAVEARADKRPMASDLRESGSLEQDADVIAFIYRDEFYNKDSREPGIAEIIISKHRNGPTGVVKLGFDGPHARFFSLAKPEDREYLETWHDRDEGRF